MRRNQKGFTLMELMVVIVIVAILAAVAVPLYINYVNDAKRTEAKGAIGAVITAQQTYYQANGQFAGDLNLLSVDLGDLAARWNVTLPSGGGNSFTVQMQGQGTNTGLTVQCQYTRGQEPVWTDDTSP